MAEIGERIKIKRELLGITQEELAQKLGYKNKSTIAKIESGKNDIVQSKVIDFANALETTIAYLMDLENESSDFPEHTYNLNSKEELLLTDFRTLNEQGQNYILQTMDMVKDKYKKSNMLSDMEEIV